MLAADAQLDVFAGAAALGHGDLHQLANAGLVDHGERVVRDDFLLLVVWQEGAGVVAAHAHGHLGEIVGAEAEELGHLGDLDGG